MAKKETVTLYEGTPQLAVPQAGDTYQFPRDMYMTTGVNISEVADGAGAVAFTWQSPAYVTGGAKVLSVKNDTTELVSVDKDGNISVIGSVVLPQEDDAATPTLAFGDGDTGFYESTDGLLEVAIEGTHNMTFSGDGIYTNANLSGGFVGSVTPTSTLPSLRPRGTDNNTGIGSNDADQLSLIAGGIEGMRLTEANSFIQNSMAGGTNTDTSGTINALSITPTYNQASGTAANTDLLINRTETAVGSGTQLLADFQVGGSSKAYIDNSGNTHVGRLYLGVGSDDSIYGDGTNLIFYPNNASSVAINATGAAIRSNSTLGWSSTTNPTQTLDLILARDAANTLAQRNSTNAQTFNLYGTFTDASNMERMSIGHDGSGTGVLNVNSAGTGNTTDFEVQFDGTSQFNIDSAGDIVIGDGSDTANYIRFFNRILFAHTGDVSAGNIMAIQSNGSSYELTDNNGKQAGLFVYPRVNQAGTAAFDGIFVDTAEESFGDGSTGDGNNLLRLASLGTTKFKVDTSGVIGAMSAKETIFIPASAMRPTVSNGCAALTDVETTAGRPDMTVLDFDASSDEHAQFQVPFPKRWNLGTVTFQVFWTTTATDTDGVAWGLQGVAVTDGDTIDVAYGTAVVVTDDAQSAAEDMLVTAESSAVTIAGTPADDDMCYFRIFRDVSDANDDMTEDARLIGIKLFYTIDTGTDA